jgi:CRISPR-associated helicase Cas3
VLDLREFFGRGVNRSPFTFQLNFRTGSVDRARSSRILVSLLLFAGYGCAFKSRPLHAGFLGQDALLVHDEAYLEPAFEELIAAVASEQQRAISVVSESWR